MVFDADSEPSNFRTAERRTDDDDHRVRNRAVLGKGMQMRESQIQSDVSKLDGPAGGARGDDERASAPQSTGTSHTPGPWFLETLDGRLPAVRRIKMPHGEAPTYTATVRAQNREHVCKLDFGYGKVYDLHNARVLAAAPELLDALKRFVGAEERTIARFTTAEIDELEIALRQARSAISKAEGR